MTAPAPDVAPRTLHVEHCMGTVFTIDVRDAGRWDDAIGDAVAWLHRVDAVFSTYRPDSDVSRLRRGELRVADADPLVAEVLELCAQVQAETDGAFTALRDGAVDPTGFVKGWAVERASDLLRNRGSANHAVNGGGDIQLAGSPEAGEPWRVGIADPRDRSALLTVVTGTDLAVATSGTAERGQHIVDPRTGHPVAPGHLSATVVGPSLSRADAYATAAFVLGAHAPAWAAARPDYELLLVAAGGAVTTSPGWSALTGG